MNRQHFLRDSVLQCCSWLAAEIGILRVFPRWIMATAALEGKKTNTGKAQQFVGRLNNR